MTPTPPHLPTRLLARALRNDPACHAILGDLHEDFVRRTRARGRLTARAAYTVDAVTLALGRLAARHLIPDIGFPTMSEITSPSGLRQDAAYALRALRRNPGFALFSAAIIGLGVGATTAVFSVLKPLLIAPLPFEDPGELVWIRNNADPDERSLSDITSRTGNLADFREQVRAFDGITGFNAFSDQGSYTLTGSGEPEQLMAYGVAHDFTEVLGLRPLLGRGFTAEEGAWRGPRAALLQHGFWVRRFASDPSVVGRSITLDGEPTTVVGVLPEDFDFASIFKPGARVDLLVPFPITRETDRWGNTLVMIGRLRPGATPESAQQELDAVVRGLGEAQPDRWGLGGWISPLQEHIARPFRSALLLLAAAAGVVLLIVCVNVSNLLLARAPGRAREVAVRKALGAPRGRLVRQLLLETVVVSALGAAAGLLVALVATRAVAGTAGLEIPMLEQVRLDGAALLFGAGVALVAGLLVGAFPALQVTEGSEAAILRASGRGSSGHRAARRVRELLAVGEIALACVLLVVGGLLLRSFSAVLDVDLGFDAENAIAWQLDPSGSFETIDEEAAIYTRITDRVRAIPGVEAVGLVDGLPLMRNRTWGMRVEGRPVDEDNPGESFYGIFPHMVDPGYRTAMRIPLVAGRDLTVDDVDDAPHVVLINESGARRVFPDGDAIGSRILTGGRSTGWEIVGVVADVRDLAPELEPGTQIYFPIAQQWDYSGLQMVVRSRTSVEATANAVQAALGEVDPAMPTRQFWTVESTVSRSMSARRFTLGVLGAFGAAALLLAGLGIYGVLAYSVAERTPELRIRMALGASAGEVLRSVLGRTLVLAGVGILAGAGVSLWASRLMGSLLYQVEGADPLAFAGAGVVMLVVAALAGLVPAARAARTDGTRALRAE